MLLRRHVHPDRSWRDRSGVTIRIGDRVVTHAGTSRPVLWIGQRQLDLTRHPTPDSVRPIRIRADAFADGVPRRDLLVSPDHAVLRDGMLIPARLLLNGASIVRATGQRAITYYHIELETHDILLAENLPAESYLDTGNRGMFANADVPCCTAAPGPGQRPGARRAGGLVRAVHRRPGARRTGIWRTLAMRAGQLGWDLPAGAGRPRTIRRAMPAGG